MQIEVENIFIKIKTVIYLFIYKLFDIVKSFLKLFKTRFSLQKFAACNHCALFWQFNFLYAIFLWHFSSVAQIRLHTCTHNTQAHKHIEHTHTFIFYFISVFAFVQLCNNHFCAANSFPLALVSLRVRDCTWVCVRVCAGGVCMCTTNAS